MESLPDTIECIQESYSKGKYRALDLTIAYLDRIKKLNETIQAFTYINEEKAITRAKELDLGGFNDNLSLWGVPIAIKENINVQGLPCSCGSKILENYKGAYDADVIEKLVQSGAIIIGITAMDEFAMGSSCENNAYVSTKNPHDLNRVPGGSSGGSAAAVASGMVPVALGSDTGGSIRQPASFCGVVGLKPTYGSVSRFGLVAYASSFDQIGPITNTAKDAAIILDVISGPDDRDSTCLPEKYFNISKTRNDQKYNIGLPKEYFCDDIDSDIKESLESLKNQIQELGHHLIEVDLPHTDYAIGAYYILATAEASANLSRFDGIRYGVRSHSVDDLEEVYVNSRTQGFGLEVKRRIFTGAYVLSSGYYDAYYLKAQKVRTLIKGDFDKVFKEVDLILTPTCPNTAFKIGEKSKDPISMYLSDVHTVSVNLAGLPAISIPCGFDSKKLPIGAQIIAPIQNESNLLNLAQEVEEKLTLTQSE